MSMNSEPTNDPRTLWQRQAVETKSFSLEEIRRKATRFQRTIRFRNLRESAAAVVVLVVFTSYAWDANTWLSKAGPALVIVGTLVILFQLHTRGASAAVPGGAAERGATVETNVAENCLQFHRCELERQRALLLTVWRWYLGPLVPGILVMFIEPFLVAWANGGLSLFVWTLSALVTVLVFLGVWRLNVIGANDLQRQVDALDAIARKK